MQEKIDILKSKLNLIGKIIYKYRYYIAVIIFIICVIFEISGSSIGCWKDFINVDNIDDGVILGVSRGIRSDEWAVLTPMSFSQKFDGFKYFSNLIRGTSTDVFIVYGLPTLNLMEIFRPFQLGYLFLGISKGLSFFWCGRFITLFLVSFELGMIITNKNKLLSFIEAIMITLSPMIQWWFAVNGVAEIFIFGQLAIILLDKYMNTDSLKKRIIYLIGLVICAGGYVLVFYPAWQIPMAYIFLALAIWIIIKNRKKCKVNYKDIILIILALAIFAICMLYVLCNSFDTIKTVMGTVYPGSRMETGGEYGSYYMQYILDIFLPFKASGIITNTCEMATMFTLFPMGLILSFIVIFKEKNKDVALISLLIVYTFLSIWCIFGFPAIIAKITLMSNTLARRTLLAVGFLDILILMRSLSIIEKPVNRIPAAIISIILSIILVLVTKKTNTTYVNKIMMICVAIMCINLFYLILRYKAKYAKLFFTFGIVFVMIMAGATVNPIRTGVGVVYDSEIIKEIQYINDEDSGKWIVEELGFPIANYVLMAGVPVINATNTYPDLDKWHMIDTELEYEEVYNRYAHIIIKLKKSEQDFEDKFELIQSDTFVVNLLPEDLRELDVKYIFTSNKLQEFNTEYISFDLIYNYKNYYVYKIVY